MERIALAVCLAVGLIVAGCRPVEKPLKRAERPSTVTPGPQSEADADGPLPESEPEAKPETDTEARAKTEAHAPRYSAERIAAAKELALQLGGKIKEDADGNVTLLDMAAGRSWVDDAQMQEILVFERLTSLTVEGPSITDFLVPRIAELQGLTSLAMHNTLIGDEGIGQLTGLKSLKTIDLRVAPMVSDASMQSLAAMPQLRAVRLIGGNVTDAGIATLLALPRLTELDVRNCRGVTIKGIELLAAKRSLRVLKIGGPKIDDDVLEVVGRMDHLTGLALDNCPITDAGMARLGKLPLVDLSLYQCPSVTDKGLGVLAGYNELCRLTLCDVGAKGAVLALLPHPQKLVSLNMAQSYITDAEVAHLGKMKNLKSLNLSETTITDAAVETLSKTTSLAQLILTQTRISDEGVARLRKALPNWVR